MISRLASARVLPVVTATSVESTVLLARALQRGGMGAIEITLRTEAALDSIRAVLSEVPDMLVAAGTVNTPAVIELVREAGVELALSPGATPALLKAAADSGLDFIPGVASSSEIMTGLEHGFELFKLFPAVALGGLDMLRSLGGPFPQVRFCPTGGLNKDNFRDFLALPNVICCGGSWMVASQLVDNGNWTEIEALARQAMAAN